MRRLFTFGSAVLSALAFAVVPANPAAAALHTVEVTGQMRVVDDEVFGEEVATHQIQRAVLVNDAVPEIFTTVQTCTGDEVRTELRIYTKLNPAGSIHVQVVALMFEGTHCFNTDPSDLEVLEIDVPPGQSVRRTVHLENDEWFGSDTADIDFRVKNSVS